MQYTFTSIYVFCFVFMKMRRVSPSSHSIHNDTPDNRARIHSPAAIDTSTPAVCAPAAHSENTKRYKYIHIHLHTKQLQTPYIKTTTLYIHLHTKQLQTPYIKTTTQHNPNTTNPNPNPPIPQPSPPLPSPPLPIAHNT